MLSSQTEIQTIKSIVISSSLLNADFNADYRYFSEQETELISIPLPLSLRFS